MTNALTVSSIQARLPMPKGMQDTDAGKWRVLCESIFPTAKSAEAILLAVDYCRARKLDIMKKPVHIVPMWSSSLGREVETVWPSITEVQTTAARTGKYAGMDEPKWGPEITRTFKGVKKGAVGETAITLTFPEWCAVTVYRMVDGVRCAFTEPVYWLEAYARIGKTELPNDMWAKRTRGQVIKVAKAFSLRAAFPEEGEHTAEEMEGRVIEEVDAGGVPVERNDPVTGEKSRPSFWKTATLRNSFTKDTQDKLNTAKNVGEINAVILQVKDKLEGMRRGDSRDELAVESIQNTYRLALSRFCEANPDITDVDVESGEMTPEERAHYEAMEQRFKDSTPPPEFLKTNKQMGY